MEKMEKVTWRIWETEGLGKALLIGGLIFYVPILNLLLLGYFGLWTKRLVLRKGLELPQWSDGRTILEESFRVIVPFLVWIFLPFALASMLGWGFSGLFDLLFLAVFASTIAWIPVAVVALFAPLALTIALMRMYTRGLLRDALDVPDILRQTIRNLRGCLFPILQFYGILAIGWPLIGFAAFLGVLPLIAQLILLLRKEEDDLKSVAY